MKIMVMQLLLLATVSPVAHAFCEVKNLFPASTVSVVTEISSGDGAGKTHKFDCPGSKMELVQTPSTFQIRNLEQSNCDASGFTFAPSHTAVIHFDDQGPFYLDFKNNRHALDVQCTADEMFINLEDRQVTWIDPWKPGPQQWRLQLKGDQISVEFAVIRPTSFVKLKTMLQ